MSVLLELLLEGTEIAGVVVGVGGDELGEHGTTGREGDAVGHGGDERLAANLDGGEELVDGGGLGGVAERREGLHGGDGHGFGAVL